ncbi:phage Gp37/Gp68 family protein [bacterium]|nr:phage Gp37/Gp68 family protein [bacterium]
MASNSSIEWTEATWNPVTGCTKVSTGCRICYAERLSKRLQAMGSPNYKDGFKLTIHDHMVGLPLTWKTPKVVFVNSMSDLFHVGVPIAFIRRVFDVMEEANWHTFQVLTKRSGRLAKIAHKLKWPPNVWMGVSVETAKYVHRIDDLRRTPAKVKFLSLEPLLGPLPNLDLTGIDWAIVGGESGPGARPMEEEWVLEIKDQCQAAKVQFFFKQWGGVQKKKNGRTLQNRTWDDMPSLPAAAC